MTDRELLELAAKAAGYEVRSDGKGGLTVSTGVGWCRDWNPLTDHGDALRLAVELRLDIEWTRDARDRVVVTDPHRAVGGENSGADAFAATCRAIVRAAAEIGRAQA